MKFTQDMFAKHMQSISGSAIRDIFKLLGKPGMISFAGGNPSNTALEPEIISGLAVEVLEKHGTSLLQYGATDGFAPLRESIADFLKTASVNADPSEILPVQGAQQAFDLLLKSLINPGDVILCESPTFLGALQAMRTYNARVIPMPMDNEGVIVEAAEELIKKHQPKLMYVIPTFQNPTGITMNLERRKALAALASQYGVVIAEDDPYRDLRYAGDELPSIKSFDEEGWVVYMSSFSKYVAPGIRLGAAVANPLLYRKMVIGKQSTDVHSPLLNQAIIDAYLRKGLLPDHIRRIRAGYEEQLKAMLDGFKSFPEGTTHTTPEGGLFVWAELPEGIDALKALDLAIEQNVAFVPGTHFYPEGGHADTLRLNFSMCDIAQIESGMQRLGQVITSMK